MLNLFKEITKNEPFPWQKRLFEVFSNGDIPRSLNIPTGLGKTSVMALWLLARAAGAPLPRRLIYIVDRRAVIDQSTVIAEELRTWLSAHPNVAEKLGLEKALPISTLRGQYTDNKEWLENPSAPAIVIGTVDLIGSRLLFEGYRCSRKMRPYHAGLLGADCLYVLDEAHLVPSFERLLERVILNGQDFSPRQTDLATPPKLHLLSLSATGRSQGGKPFGLEHHDDEAQDDFKNVVVAKRLNAKKRVRLESLTGKKDELREKLAEKAWALSEEGTKPIRCLIFANKREDAEKALAKMQKLAGLNKIKKGEMPKADVELLVGGRRIFERMASAKRLEELGFLAGNNVEHTRPAFLFATSAGEVGIDLDADHLVCDLVQWERMIQRLGRVNRRGDGDAEVHVFREPRPVADKKQQEAIDAEKNRPAVDETIDLNSLSKAELREHKEKLKKAENKSAKNREHIAKHQATVAGWQKLARPFKELPLFHDDLGEEYCDGSPGAFRDLQHRAHSDEALATLLKEASSAAPLFPRLDRATLDAWSMTSLKEHPGRPIVAPWLRGWIEETPQTALVWRKHLPLNNDGKVLKKGEVKRFFKAAPPHLSEILETESFRAGVWLVKRIEALLNDKKKKSAKTSKKEDEAPPQNRIKPESIVAFVVDSKGSAISWTAQQLLDKPIADLKTKILPNQTLILDERLAGLTQGLLDDKKEAALCVADREPWLDDLDDGPPIRYRVSTTDNTAATRDKNWRERERFVIKRKADGEAEKWLVVDKWRHDAATEDDRSAGNAQTLVDHQLCAATHAEKLAQRLGLSDEAKALLSIAARLHDEGKRATRWQRAFHAPEDGVYAKTLGPVNVKALEGYRHEFGSLPYAQRDEAFVALPAEHQDLVLHLIASHHGNARPTIRTTGGDDAPPSALQERACEVALRFARLQQAWGPWGLAWWESLLRAADVLASRENDQRDENQEEVADG